MGPHDLKIGVALSHDFYSPKFKDMKSFMLVSGDLTVHEFKQLYIIRKERPFSASHEVRRSQTLPADYLGP